MDNSANPKMFTGIEEAETRVTDDILGMSRRIADLFTALSKAQGSFSQPKKTHANPYYGTQYADLGDTIEATHKALSDNELCTFHGVSVDVKGQAVTVSTRLGHTSGQWVQVKITLPATMKGKDGQVRFDAQSIGSAITYGRRYGLSAILGIASEEDDDGNAAVEKKPAKQKKDKTSKPDPKPLLDHGKIQRQLIINEIAKVVKHELISDLERQDARAHIQAAETCNDLSAVCGNWTMKRDQRIAAREDAEKAKADMPGEELETKEPEKADLGIF